MPRGRSVPHVVLIVAAALLLYAPYLGSAPIYLGQDEVFFAVSAQSIAATAHDINGRFLPLYFQWPGRSPAVWFQPIPVYFTALFLKVLPVSEWTIRLPTLVVGLTDIVLIYFIASRIFQRGRSAIVAAVLLMLTPAHLIHSRLAMDFLYPLVFVMAWFLCLLIFMERQQLSRLFAATTFLGIGFYSYIAAVAMMPIYFFITCLTLVKTRKDQYGPWWSPPPASSGRCWPQCRGCSVTAQQLSTRRKGTDWTQ
jgi:4-amino-4-deoxy-L-arabinose transferase-like glycosyltransferase